MGYDRGDSFTFDFISNGIPFGSKSKGKLSPRSYPIQCERKWKYNFLSVFTVLWRGSQRRFKEGGRVTLMLSEVRDCDGWELVVANGKKNLMY